MDRVVIISAVILITSLVVCSCKWKLDSQVKVSSSREQEYKIIKPQSRASMLMRLKQENFDILIIGGGAAGAGAALEAASRGLKVGLIDAKDFSSGTSSRSTKLIHGGVRYLEKAFKNFDYKELQLVRDALRERKIFLNNAPHLTNKIALLTPVYSWFDAAYYFVGLKIYDLLSGNSSFGSSEYVDFKETIQRFPMLKKDELFGSVVYYDGQFNDARMNITLILSGIKEGAVAANYVRAENFIKEDNLIVGVMAHDELSRKTWPIYARQVINATGPHVDKLRQIDNPQASNLLNLSQGTHILLPDSFSVAKFGLVIPKTKDNRVLFLLPWLNKTLVGTTDEAEQLKDWPQPSEKEIEFIISHVKEFIDLPLEREDILASFSGIRPLARATGKEKTSGLSRDHIIDISNSNLISITGGKWTTYRLMAQDVINTAIKKANLSPQRPSISENLKLVGSQYYKKSLIQELINFEKLDSDIAQHLVTSYGDRADILLALGKNNKKRIITGYPYVQAEVIYGIRYEYAQNIVDILARRTRLAFLDNKASQKSIYKIAALMARELNWNRVKTRKEINYAKKFLDTMTVKK